MQTRTESLPRGKVRVIVGKFNTICHYADAETVAVKLKVAMDRERMVCPKCKQKVK